VDHIIQDILDNASFLFFLQALPEIDRNQLFDSRKLLIFFGKSSNSNTFPNGGKSETEISRILEQKSPSISDLNQEAQPEQVRKGTQIALKISSRPSWLKSEREFC
jgi:hypothetical protein